MSQPADDGRNYTLTFRSQMDSVGHGVFAYMQVVRVDGPSGRAVMLLNRHGGDRIRLPVGLFGTTLSKTEIAGVGATIEGIKWGDLRKPQGGDVSAATLSIDYAHGSRIIQRSFNARNGELLLALAPVMTQVGDLSTAIEAHPQRAVDVAVARTEHGFKLVLRNVGTGPVLIADPRHMAGAFATARATVRVASSPPQTDFTDLTWESIALQPLGAAPASVTLAPGKTHEVETVAWTARVLGEHFAQGTWQDYAGPDVDAKAIMPMLPEPDHLADSRPYVIRGAAFSPYVKFTVEKPRR